MFLWTRLRKIDKSKDDPDAPCVIEHLTERCESMEGVFPELLVDHCRQIYLGFLCYLTGSNQVAGEIAYLEPQLLLRCASVDFQIS